MLRVHVVGPRSGTPLQRALAEAPWGAAGFVLADAQADVHLLVAETPVSPADQSEVAAQSRAAGAVLVIAGPTLDHVAGGVLDPFAGAQAPMPPVHRVRLEAVDLDWPRGTVEVDDTFPLYVAPGRVLARSNVAYTDYPVIYAHDAVDAVIVAVGHEPSTWSNTRFLQLLHQALVAAVRLDVPADVRVGLLGFGAIGAEHAAAIAAVPGLSLAAVCDGNRERIDAARAQAPSARFHLSADDLLGDAGVDLIVVSTPPNTHAQWALRALDAGKHVVLEKPMALTAAECDAVLERADSLGLSALVYQNRRFDPDFRTLESLAHALGEVFHAEAFIGGHSQPCSYWHSEVTVSGGALFDWGSHVVDQLLQLMPGKVDYVTALNHKRVWHHVTNADHSRLTIAFDGGREATFIFSDLAAAMKPRWYVLGTTGAVVGDWRYERVVSRNSVGTLNEDLLAPADAPPTMRFVTPDGSVTTLSAPPHEQFPFHSDLSLWLRWGIPPRVLGAQSRRVVAVLEAAEQSAALGGRPVTPP